MYGGPETREYVEKIDYMLPEESPARSKTSVPPVEKEHYLRADEEQMKREREYITPRSRKIVEPSRSNRDVDQILQYVRDRSVNPDVGSLD